MTRIEIDLPDNDIAFLEKLAQERGWRLGKRILNPEEIRKDLSPMWNSEIAHARELLTLAKNPANPTVRLLQGQNTLKLINDAFSRRQVPNFLSRLKNTGIDWDTARDTLLAVLDSYLTDEPPEGTYLVTSPLGKKIIKNRKRPILQPERIDHGFAFCLPSEVTLLIESYGLADGSIKPKAELTKKYNTHPSTLQDKLNTALNVIYVNPTLRAMILEKP